MAPLDPLSVRLRWWLVLTKGAFTKGLLQVQGDNPAMTLDGNLQADIHGKRWGASAAQGCRRVDEVSSRGVESDQE